MNRSIVYYVASTFWGGGEQYIYNLCLSLRERGYQLAFVLQPDSEPVVCERFSSLGDILSLRIHTKNGKFSLLSATRLKNFARSHNAEIVHVNALKDYFVAVWAKILSHGRFRIVATNHLVERSKSKPTWRWAYRHIDCLVNVSECAKREFLSSGTEHCFKHITVVLNSVPPKTAATHESRGNDVKALYQGRVCHEKGILDLAAQWDNDKVKLYIAGAGAEIKNDRVVQLGFRADIRDLISQFDICIVPSLARESGGPLSLIEAMAAACPVIASNNGSQPEYMRDGVDGILCNPGDWSAFDNAVNRLAEDSELRRQMGENAYCHYCNDFSFNNFVDSIVNVYEQTL